MHASATATVDPRAGASWLAAAGPVERLQLLAALLSRFNHDFRTPLNTIVGWGHLLQLGSVAPERSSHVAEVISRNARDQTLMLEAFIEDGRIILDRLPLEPATVRIDEVVAQAIKRANCAAQSRGSALRVEIDSGGAAVDGNGRLLQRLIDRLFIVIACRAQEGAAIDLRVSKKDRLICLSLKATALDADWTEADLLELRIATLMAAVFRGSLELLADPGSAALKLQLPEAARAK
jgi:signal transduction histidine kinase